MPEVRPHLDVLGNPIDLANPRTVLFWDGTFLRAASVHITGRLIVRGEDQLFTFKEHLRDRRDAVISGANGYTESDGPGAGLVWVVTNIACSDRTSPTTAHGRMLQDGAVAVLFSGEVAAFGASVSSYWSGHLYLEEGDVVRVFFEGGLAGDTCRVELTGYQMTLET